MKSYKSKIDALQTANFKVREMYENQKSISSAISHELRTPLASIKMAIDIVLGGKPGPLNEDQANMLNKAKTNIDRLKRLINEILEYSKLESGKIEFHYEKQDMNEVLGEIIDFQQSVASEKGLKIIDMTEKGLPKIMFDKDKIVQVVNNLVNNAIKFTEQGSITIISKQIVEEQSIYVSVEDTGEGIEAENISKLFQEFQQLGNPAERKEGGTGLGLAICKEIIQRHQGKIWVDSQLGKGSHFHFTLPMNRKEEKGL